MLYEHFREQDLTKKGYGMAPAARFDGRDVARPHALSGPRRACLFDSVHALQLGARRRHQEGEEEEGRGGLSGSGAVRRMLLYFLLAVRLAHFPGLPLWLCCVCANVCVCVCVFGRRLFENTIQRQKGSCQLDQALSHSGRAGSGRRSRAHQSR